MKNISKNKEKINKKNKIIVFVILIAIFILLICCFLYFLNKCPNGYIKIDGTCVKIIDKIESIKDYYCKDDEYYNSSNNTCSKKIEVAAERKLYCSYGKLKGDKCAIEEIENYYHYYCIQGELQGTKCIVTIKPQIDKYCSVFMYSIYYDPVTDESYCKYTATVEDFTKCPSSSMTYSSADERCYPKMPVEYKYYCNGYRSSTPNCEGFTTDAIYKEGCSEGFERHGKKCIKTTYEDASYTYKCKEGYKSNCNNDPSNFVCTCVGTKTSKPKYRLKCKSRYRLVKNKCILYKK